ncbi:vascular endothelial growth factor receptor 1-like [Paramacrobiotus metropolitanus]|uniref:vascular endothelial growth factor receptor 1-like n=1 Tax=Paramacrobiotus metropolitanus TaxID=2943436 RepID=UPI0024459AB8|nr:vascular endothelial growth factor receptor 1-like [Paramacrobiotus metropolitanus]
MFNPLGAAFVSSLLLIFGILASPGFVTGDTDSKEIFRDDFNGTLLDRRWTVTDQTLPPSTLAPDDRQNIRIEGGALRLEVGTRRSGAGVLRTPRYVNTKFGFHFKYGVLIIRAQLPPEKTLLPCVFLYSCTMLAGFRCAVPAVPSVFIGLPTARWRIVEGVVNYLDSSGNTSSHASQFTSDRNLSVDYHVYTLEWTSQQLIWYVDDHWALNLTVPGLDTWPKMYLGLGIMHTDGNTSAINETLHPFLIDSIVVRQPLKRHLPISSTVQRGVVATVTLSTVIPAVVLAVALVSGYLMCRHRRRRLQHGDMLHFSRHLGCLQNTQFSCGFDTELLTMDVATERYVRQLEIPLAQLQLSDIVLNSSAAYIIRKGSVFRIHQQPDADSLIEIAVKSARSSTSTGQLRRLIHELEIMAKVGRHLNIVNLLGVVITGDIRMLLEYCKYGPLTDLLRKWSHEASEPQLSSIQSAKPNYDGSVGTLEIAAFEISSEEEEPAFSTEILVQFAYQISRGVEYLHSQFILHRDLAARNILVHSNNIVKISHFGMARAGSEFVVHDMQEALPVRWMPPEAIENGVFTPPSDVWSLGVVLWEVCSLGAVPYAGVSAIPHRTVSAFLSALQNGLRLEKPAQCSAIMYELLRQCWALAPNERKTSSWLAEQLRNIVETESEEAYLRLSYSYVQFNETCREYLAKP